MDNQDFILLVTKELSGEITAEELELLHREMLAQPVLRTQHSTLKAFWEAENASSYQSTEVAFRKVSGRIAILEKEKKSEEAPVIPVGKRPWMRWSIAAAAAFLVVASGVYLFKVRQEGLLASAKWQEKYTPRKTRSTIVLTDGTRIILNSDSKLKFPESFGGAGREVFLTGEAFFDVAKNVEHPFIIHTQKMDIKVLGTSFNVRTYPNETTSETTLISGAVEIKMADRPSDKIYLKPNDKFVLTNQEAAGKKPDLTKKSNGTHSSYALATLTHYDAMDDSSEIVETSWINNKLVFRNEAFGDLAKKIERWYGVNVAFQNPQTEKLKFTGVFERESLEQALTALQMTEKFQFAIKGETLFIL